MNIDMHCHTTASDGIYTPTNLVKLALSEKIDIIAIADHDTINGIEEALAYGNNNKIVIVPAVEFSIDFDKGTFHLLGYNIDYNNVDLKKKLKDLADYRFNRIYDIVDDLKKNGIDIPVEEIIEEAKGGAAGKPHVARVMIKYGYADSVEHIFDNYLTDGKAGDVPKKRIKLDEALNLINISGGKAVIAHPGTIRCGDNESFRSFIGDLTSKGLSGIEVYSGMHNDKEIGFFKDIAVENNLVQFGGSDFHGDRDEVLGCYGDNRIIPSEITFSIRKLLGI